MMASLRIQIFIVKATCYAALALGPVRQFWNHYETWQALLLIFSSTENEFVTNSQEVWFDSRVSVYFLSLPWQALKMLIAQLFRWNQSQVELRFITSWALDFHRMKIINFITTCQRCQKLWAKQHLSWVACPQSSPAASAMKPWSGLSPPLVATLSARSVSGLSVVWIS